VIRNFTETELTEEIFNAANETGQSTLHTAEGVVTIPARFTEDGYTMAIVSVSGVNFIPVEPPQDATFPCLRVPEFPIGLVGVAGAVIVAAIVATTRHNNRRDLTAFHWPFS
jgi:hypothetical protein